MNEQSKWQDNEPEIKSMNVMLDALREHWDNVQVFCSRIDPDPKKEDDAGSTQRLIMGRGNYYARIGQVKEWVTTEDQKTREEARDKYREENEP
jgi:hypothetical protein